MNTQEIVSYRVPTGAEIREFVQRVNESAFVGRARFISPMGQVFPLESIECVSLEAASLQLKVAYGVGVVNLGWHQLFGVIETRLSFMSPFGSCDPVWLGLAEPDYDSLSAVAIASVEGGAK